ncbi:hypothetical protein BV25DRAFT_1918331 [Artomyces pyxidatus]|uniref:Uncharacterized protein n=1 Tax=Artomyces pyxidatus TaxID=48021 RepID=A0ACB8ST36_9AGAM|nr:hypothetical protein BV25DRAFT_1918331 [Artomyces pyxidatus]
MADRQKDRPTSARKLSWKSVYGGGSSKEKDQTPSSALSTPKEGVELLSYSNTSRSSSVASLPSPWPTTAQPIPTHPRSNSVSENSSPASSRPTTPLFSRWSSNSVLTKQQIDGSPGAQTSLSRTSSRPETTTGPPELNARSSGSFSRMSFSSMMGGLSALSLTRSSNDDAARGRQLAKAKSKEDKERARSSSAAPRPGPDDPASVRSRSTSPFHVRRSRTRDASPTVGALSLSEAESDSESLHGTRPRSAYSVSDDEDADSADSGDSEEEWSDVDQFDTETEANTERNALVVPAEIPDADALDLADPLGEGVNVVVPPEPYFPTTLNHTGRNPRRRKSTRHEPLPLRTARPVFQRDRCTISITQGDPETLLKETGRRPRRYVIASDMSDESRYAVEWGIGTVLKDGDEMLIVTVVESDSKTDPPVPNAADRAAKLRSQQERQGLAYILCRQATSLLQRTRLNVTISCEAWHAKNARHMILDIVDYNDPVMLIVGSRGIGQLKGILLGSTSHYLIQRCSVPVMVARRRLKRPPRRAAHLAKHRARLSLAEAAGIERVTPRVDEEVAHMRDEITRDEDRESERMRMQREDGDGDGDDEDVETEVEGEGHGRAPVERKPTG